MLRDALEVDVAVVGAGPAGCAAATYLARRGVNVAVFDRAVFPRTKVCGDGVAPRAVAALADLGVERLLEERGFHRVGRFRVVGSRGLGVEAGIRRRGSYPDYGYVVPRSELDDVLVATARSRGAHVYEGVRVDRLLPEGRGGHPRLLAVGSEGTETIVTARVVVAADGSRGSFSRSFVPRGALTPDVIAMRAYMTGVRDVEGALHFFLDPPLLPGYGWIFPPGREGAPANVGVGMPVGALRRRGVGLRDVFSWFLGPESSAASHLRGARFISAPAASPLQLRFRRGVRRVGSCLLVGDAANLVNPLSGEGIAYALESGRMAADACMQALLEGSEALSTYERSIERAFATDYLEAYWLRRLLSLPAVNAWVVTLLRRDERLAMGAMGILTNTVRPGRLLEPRLWADILSPTRLRGVARGRDGEPTKRM